MRLAPPLPLFQNSLASVQSITLLEMVQLDRLLLCEIMRVLCSRSNSGNRDIGDRLEAARGVDFEVILYQLSLA